MKKSTKDLIDNFHFWNSIIKNNRTQKIDIKQIMKELLDFRVCLENVPKVYCHITNGQLSYATYPAETVIAAADDVLNDAVSEAVEEALEDYEEEQR